MSYFVNGLQANPIKAITTMQASSQDDLAKFMSERLDIAQRIHRFLQIHKGADSENFIRGMTLGLAFGIAGARDHMTVGHVAADLQVLIAQQTMRNINIFTGEELRNEEVSDQLSLDTGA